MPIIENFPMEVGCKIPFHHLSLRFWCKGSFQNSRMRDCSEPTAGGAACLMVLRARHTVARADTDADADGLAEREGGRRTKEGGPARRIRSAGERAGAFIHLPDCPKRPRRYTLVRVRRPILQRILPTFLPLPVSEDFFTAAFALLCLSLTTSLFSPFFKR